MARFNNMIGRRNGRRDSSGDKMMNRKTKLAAILALGTVLAGGAGLAFAQTAATDDDAAPAAGPGGAPMGPMAMFATLDADKDGKVTKDELLAHRRDRAAAIDVNGDGQISLDEFTAAVAAMPGRRAPDADAVKERFADRDLDGNGQLTAAEMMMPGMPLRMLDRFDADGDGAVSHDEMVDGIWRMRGGDDEDGGRRKGRGHGHDGMMGWGMMDGGGRGFGMWWGDDD